jgi:hypothetical protein
MSLEWFDRVCGELQDHLESLCEEYDQVGQMSIERAAKHPRIEFFVETEEEETYELDREYFCSLFFDPLNEEFYINSFDMDSGLTSKIILSDIEEIVDVVHESIHDFLNNEDHFTDDGVYVTSEEDYEENCDDEVDYDEEYYQAEQINTDEIFEEIDVEWETPEVTAFKHADEVEITYQFGVIQETGDGVLKRINRIWTTEDELIKDESHFIFSKEEANTIIAMIASHMNSLSEFNFDNRG